MLEPELEGLGSAKEDSALLVGTRAIGVSAVTVGWAWSIFWEELFLTVLSDVAGVLPGGIVPIKSGRWCALAEGASGFGLRGVAFISG